MKKTLLIITTLALGPLAYALPVGNPAEASLLCEGSLGESFYYHPFDAMPDCFPSMSLRFGYYGDFVQNRHLEIDNGPADGKEVEFTELETHAGYVALNFWNRIDLFATFGAFNALIETSRRAFGGDATRNEVRTESDFSSSIGVRATLWECGCFRFGGEVHYFSTRPDIKIVNILNNLRYVDDLARFKYREWQVGVGATFCIHRFIYPYAAIKWASVMVDVDKFFTEFLVETTFFKSPLFNLTNRKEFGYAVGFSMVACDWFNLTLERRFADERAFYLNAQLRF